MADLEDARLYAYSREGGERIAGKDIATGPAPMGLWSDGGTLLATSWEGTEVRSYRLPEAVAGAPRKDPGNGLTARAVSLPTIADPALKAAIGAVLGKAPGDSVSPQELAGLEALTARNAGIRDLSGLEQAVGLKELDLGFNPLADLRPLAALLALESLNLDGAAANLQALAPLARLQRLSLRHNRIADLRPLAGLGKLSVLRADRNLIADMWPLASLAWIHVGGSRIEDLTPLDGLDGLTVAGREDRDLHGAFHGRAGREGRH